MRALQPNPKLSQRDLAREVGISLGGVNSGLKVLIDRGCITVETFRTSNKTRYAYVLTSEGLAEKRGLQDEVCTENSDKQRWFVLSRIGTLF